LLRAFIAIEIPPEIKKAISAQTASLQQNSGRAVRWIAPENIHLTLKFLGEISPANLQMLTQTLQAECIEHSPFDITVASLGSFPNPRRPRVIWIGLDIPPELNRLQRNIESVTSRLGYTTEDKPFAPHLTIGRVREQASTAEIQSLRTALENTQVGKLGTFSVHTVYLYKSDLRPSGPIYSRLSSAPLANNA
jgi:2'-5' RNA ligase